jgi:hypothetical protein
MCSLLIYNPPPLAFLLTVVWFELDGGNMRLAVFARICASKGVICVILSPALLLFGGGVSQDADGSLCDMVAGIFWSAMLTFLIFGGDFGSSCVFRGCCWISCWCVVGLM